MWDHGVEVSSDPAKRGVKGHSSPARAGEHPRGLVLACDTRGHVERCLLPGVAAQSGKQSCSLQRTTEMEGWMTQTEWELGWGISTGYPLGSIWECPTWNFFFFLNPTSLLDGRVPRCPACQDGPPRAALGSLAVAERGCLLNYLSVTRLSCVNVI